MGMNMGAYGIIWSCITFMINDDTEVQFDGPSCCVKDIGMREVLYNH